MIEHPLSEYTNMAGEKLFHRGRIQSELFVGSDEELYAAYVRYRSLFEFGRLVTSQTQIDKIIDTLLEKLIFLIHAERCLLLLFNQTGEIIYQVGRQLNHSEIERPEFEVSWSIIDKVKTTLEPLYLENALGSNLFSVKKSILRLRILSVVCLPVLYEGECIGVLYADNRTLKGVFKQEYCDLLHNFISLITGPLAAALHHKELENRIQSQRTLPPKYPSIVGSSPVIQKVFSFIEKVADTSATVIIEGETGTGKELVARALHDKSRRRMKPFVSLNCGALTETLLESELFGHVKGAFTGAVHSKKGWFETADGGTIFFDEVGEMSLGLQVKLLRILQTGEYSPVGSNEIKKSDVRIIVATNQHLQTLVQQGKFRPDLYYRLNILYLYIPPLRDRREDIILLATHYLQHHGRQRQIENISMSPAVQEALRNYDFPGNIRELENFIQHAVVIMEGTEVQLRDLPEAVVPCECDEIPSTSANFAGMKKVMVERFEKTYFESTLEKAHGVIAQAARMAGIDSKNFYQKMRKYQIKANHR